MDFNDDITAAIKVLEAGGLILYPTDTIWGIGCDATNEAAVQKIFTLKQRADEKSMIVLLPSERDVIRYVGQPDLAVFDFLETVTKSTTIIYPGAVGLAANLVGADGSIGIRITAKNPSFPPLLTFPTTRRRKFLKTSPLK
jgi:L-threonylcarbamoyladenylate synthase